MKCFIAKANIQKKIVRNSSEINHLYSIKKLKIILSIHTHAHQMYNSENKKTQQVSHIYFQNISKTIYRMPGTGAVNYASMFLFDICCSWFTSLEFLVSQTSDHFSSRSEGLEMWLIKQKHCLMQLAFISNIFIFVIRKKKLQPKKVLWVIVLQNRDYTPSLPFSTFLLITKWN